MIDLQKRIGYKFVDESILLQALTHSSYANDNNEESYERLEYLGDAVIELVVSEYIYRYYYFGSGESSKLRASLVSTEYLYKISESLGLDMLVRKSKSLQSLSKKNTADLFESLIGAIYIDGGILPATEVVKRFVIVDITNVDFILNNSIDFKTKLQEQMQAEGKEFEYRVVESKGLDHEKTFQVELLIDNKVVATEWGKSIHEAQSNCAKCYFKSDTNKNLCKV